MAVVVVTAMAVEYPAVSGQILSSFVRLPYSLRLLKNLGIITPQAYEKEALI